MKLFLGAVAYCVGMMWACAEVDEAWVRDRWENAFELYREIPKEEGNVVFSPYGASTLMGLAYGGARGETATQIEKGFHFTSDPKFHEQMGETITKINGLNEKGVLDLLTKNSLWVQNGFEIESEFEALVKNQYQAHVQNLDLQGKSEESANAINAWISEQTRNFIQNVVTPALVKPSLLLAVNTIYMKGIWQSPFDVGSTQKRDFNVPKKPTFSVWTMHKQADFAYTETERFKAIRLPYQSVAANKTALLILLPQKYELIEETEKNVNAAIVMDLWTKLKREEVNLYLPKFSFERKIGLVKSAQALGVRDLFDLNVNLSGISRNDLLVSDYFQQAKIELDEKGTVASAVTVMTKRGGAPSLSLESEPKLFRADHPFLFFIIEPETKTILFMGRVTDPTLQ